MEKLIAVFDIKLLNRFLFESTSKESPCFDFQIEDYDVQLCLMANFETIDQPEMSAERYWASGSTNVRITVSHSETLEPPLKVLSTDDEDIKIALSKNMDYFGDRFPAYEEIASKALNRAVRFFKYAMHNPLLEEFKRIVVAPKWFDENFIELDVIPMKVVLADMTDYAIYQFDANYLTPDRNNELQLVLQEDISVSLYEELLSDAQSALVREHFRLAVLDMAIACEVLIKQFYFFQGSLAAVAFDYLEEKQQVEVSPTELIHKVAKRAFGESFQEFSRNDYNNIEYIFRCRNKVAHRGELTYRDSNGNVITPTPEILEAWWNSIQSLINWLNANRPA